MKLGAVIVAAGMSTRMQEFKQLLKVGNLTMAERVALNFQRAGAEEIVMVTGYRAAFLKSKLDYLDIRFIENPDYETTDMFESAKRGLEYLQGRCDRVLFCPVDIPFFSDETVRKVLACPEKIVMPRYEGKNGHPVAIDAGLIPGILSYKGDRGLKGALESTGLPIYLIEVQDPGAVMDADTQADYQKLLQLHNERLIKPTVHLGIAAGKECFTEETAALLEWIEIDRSVKEACRHAGFSYSKGWGLINTAEAGLGYSLVKRLPGGKQGGEASLTKDGGMFLRSYRELQSCLQETAKEKYSELFLGGE